MNIDFYKSILLILFYSIISGIAVIFFKFDVPYKTIFIIFTIILVLFTARAVYVIKFEDQKKLLGFIINLSLFVFILIVCSFLEYDLKLEKLIVITLILLSGLIILILGEIIARGKKIIWLIYLAIILILVINYKQIPLYNDYLRDNSIKVECNTQGEKTIPCNSYFDCRREKLKDYCGALDYTLGTRCDYECSIKTFCLDGYCRTSSYMDTWVAW
ncbi:MAG: hypothetical protein ABIH48_02805 [Candidatus Falkowbacteria bacterium]